MATGVAARELKLPPEGRLASRPLEALLGLLGVLRATGVLDITRKKHLRRFVIVDGALLTMISNARDDRFLEWYLHEVGTALSEEQQTSLLDDAGQATLTAGYLIRHQIVELGALPDLVRRYLERQLSSTAAWNDATYKITPGRIALNGEPEARLPALGAALVLARAKLLEAKRPPPPPAQVVAATGWVDLGLPLTAEERLLLERAEGAVRSAELTRESDQYERALAVLVRVGLMQEAAIAAEEQHDDGLTQDVTEGELRQWLDAAAQENLAGLLEVPPHADPALVRKAYYRTVRRFHPDRFRNGPLAAYHPQVEAAFHLVHDAQEVLTSTVAREAWERRRQNPTAPDPGRAARDHFARARQALQQGRRGEAVDYLERAVKLPAHEATHELFLWLLLLGNPRRRGEALKQLEALAAANPGRSDIMAGVALALVRNGQDAAGKALARQTLQLNPTELLARAINGNADAQAEAKRDPLLAALI